MPIQPFVSSCLILCRTRTGVVIPFIPRTMCWFLALGNPSGTIRHRRFSSADAVSSRRPRPI
ncbi:hypothetical protein DXC70_02030 [Bifidobacterium bifidum]|nr:hypothetical protein DXC70_02030 [Bifidobacterium bifidum]